MGRPVLATLENTNIFVANDCVRVRVGNVRGLDALVRPLVADKKVDKFAEASSPAARSTLLVNVTIAFRASIALSTPIGSRSTSALSASPAWANRAPASS
jgi:hypothetical protein